MLRDIGRYSGAGVADPQPHVPALPRPGSTGDGVGVHRYVAGIDGQHPASGHGVTGVDREIHQHLLQLARVGQHRPQVTGERGDQLDVLAEGPAQHFLDRGDDGVEVKDLRPDHVAAGEDEQLVGEPGCPFAGFLDLREVSAGRFQVRGQVWAGYSRGCGDFFGDERDIVEDHREQVVEVVRDPAGELAEAFEALGLRLQSLLPLQGLPVLAGGGVVGAVGAVEVFAVFAAGGVVGDVGAFEVFAIFAAGGVVGDVGAFEVFAVFAAGGVVGDVGAFEVFAAFAAGGVVGDVGAFEVFAAFAAGGVVGDVGAFEVFAIFAAGGIVGHLGPFEVLPVLAAGGVVGHLGPLQDLAAFGVSLSPPGIRLPIPRRLDHVKHPQTGRRGQRRRAAVQHESARSGAFPRPNIRTRLTTHYHSG